MSDLNPLNGGNFVHNNQRWVDGGSILKRFSLAGKTAIITGAGAGIGYAVAQAYAELGCNLALFYFTNTKTPERAEGLAKQYSVQCKLARLRSLYQRPSCFPLTQFLRQGLPG